MKNFWLARRPRICQQHNPYADFYGKWYIIKYSDLLGTDLYLHKDGVWRVTTFNVDIGYYAGFYDSKADAELILRSSSVQPKL